MITVTKSGYVTQQVTFPCCDSTPVMISVPLPRVVSVTLSGPMSIAVTEAVRITATIQLDDGTRQTLTPMFLTTPGGHVRNSPRGPGTIEGVSPGSDTVYWSYYGTSGALNITVTPG